jgi:3-phenylpropionate/trans-cinnamate dioxygenase ferredoxin reductase component
MKGQRLANGQHLVKPDADVLVVGGGLAAQRCCETLRRHGYDGRIVVLCEESHLPYDRPPLSKTALTDPEAPRRPSFRAAEWYADHDVELLLDSPAQRLDAAARTVTLQQGSRRAAKPASLRYRRLVIATGSRPRTPEGLPASQAIHQLRTYEDALRLRAALRATRRRLVIVGAGLVGLEVASSALALGCEVSVIEAAATPLRRALPPQLGRWLAGLHRARGIDVRLAVTVTRVSRHAQELRLHLNDGSTIAADVLLLAIGSVPATEWLAGSGLRAGPIPTGATGATALPDIYAAGDAACPPNPYLHVPTPTPHWDAAAREGATVARAILGLPALPQTPPMFWSDQHERRIQLVGDAPHDSQIDFDGDPCTGEPFAAWITHERQPAGAMLVDRPDALPRARRWVINAAEQRAAPHQPSEVSENDMSASDR